MTDTIPLSIDCDQSLILALLSTVPLRPDIHKLPVDHATSARSYSPESLVFEEQVRQLSSNAGLHHWTHDSLVKKKARRGCLYWVSTNEQT